MSEEKELETWRARMSEVLKRMTVRVEEIAAKCSRHGGAREVVMEQFSQEMANAETLLRELEGKQLMDAELAEALESAEIHTGEKLLAVLETGGEVNERIEKIKELMHVDEEEDDEVVISRITRLKGQLEAMSNAMDCEPRDCVSRCKQILKENREKREKLERKKRLVDRVQNNASVQRLLNKSVRSRESTLDVEDGRDPDELRTSTPLNSRVPSVERIFQGFGSFEAPRTSPVLLENRGGSTQVESALEKLLKAQALPPLEEFRGSDDRDFGRFMRVFEVKYSETVFADDVRKDILVDMLKGDAKPIYDRLPESVKKGQFKELVKKMTEEFKGDKKLKALTAMNRVRGLRLQSGRLQAYCDELERLTRKAYPGLNDEELSFVRSEQLYQQVSHWKDSLKLAEILETCDNKEMYDKMKETALRMERLQSLNMSRMNYGFGMKSREGQGNGGEGRASSGQSGQLPVDKGQCFNCGEVGHKKAECRKPRLTQRPGTGYHTRVGQVHVKGSEKEIGPLTELIRSIPEYEPEGIPRNNGKGTKIVTVFVRKCQVSEEIKEKGEIKSEVTTREWSGNDGGKRNLNGWSAEKHMERSEEGVNRSGDSRRIRRRRRKQFHDNYGAALDQYDYMPP